MFALAVLAACTDPPLVAEPPLDDTGVPLPSAGDATLREHTVILPAHVTGSAIVEASQVTFPADPSVLYLQRGNVIVSGSGDGFIRRVYSVERIADTVRVVTSRATLADAVSHATFHATFVADGPIAFEDTIAGSTDALTATIAGGLSITPTFELDFTLGESIEAFDIAVVGSGAAKVEGTIRFTSPNHRAWGEEKPAGAQTVFRRTFALGPLPIVVVGRMTATLAANAYVEQNVTFTTGIEATLSVDARSSWDPAAAGWVTTDASTFAARQLGPAHAGEGRASLAIGVAPRFELAFYGVAGPRISIHTQAGGVGTYCNAALITGLQAALIGDATFDLEPITTEQMTFVRLFDNRVSLDAFEACN